MLNKKYLAFGLTLTLSSSLYAGTLTNHLKSLQADYQEQVGKQTGQTFRPNDTSLPVVKNDKVIVTIVVKNNAINKVKADLIKKGMTEIAVYNNLISGAFPINRLNELENVQNIGSIGSSKAITKAFSNGGIAQNSADAAMFTDLVKKRYNVDGSNITIGVMSDSYNCLAEIKKNSTSTNTTTTGTPSNIITAEDDVASGDLPDNVRVIKEYPFCTDGNAHDEGRAMMQLIHDIAPHAKLLFYTASVSEVAMAEGIRALKTAGAKIIVDDIGWLQALMFQDGVAAQAVDEVTAAGVTYFSAAGNDARLSYEKDFVSGKVPASQDTAHDFGKAENKANTPDFYQPIFIPKGTTVQFVLQWDDPSEIAGGDSAKTDLDMYLLDVNKKVIRTSSQDSNIGHDAVESMIFTTPKEPETTGNATAKTETVTAKDLNYYLYISHRAGVAPKHIKYVAFNLGGVGGEPSYAEQMSKTTVEYTKPNGTKFRVGAFDKSDKTKLSLVDLANLDTDKEYDRYRNGKAVVAVKSDTTEEYEIVELDYIFGNYSQCDVNGKNCSLFTQNDKKGNTTDKVNGSNTVYSSDITLYYNGKSIDVGSDAYPVWYLPPYSTSFVDNQGRMRITPLPTTIKKYDTKSGTIFGHPNAAGAIAVGAMSYQETPWFNVNVFDSKIEGFSSAGGTPIFFDKKGKRLTTPEYRPKPEIIAVDDIDTTFFGGNDTDGNGFENFKGTSAAAPNAAATAALLLQTNPYLAPNTVKTSMMKTALGLADIVTVEESNLPVTNPCNSTTVFNWGTGCGLLQADLFFDKAMTNSDGVFLSLEANKAKPKAGESVDYEFRVYNQTTKPLTDVKIVSSQVPQNITFGDVTGCTSVTATSSAFSCSIGTLASKESAVVKVPLTTKNNPSAMLRFIADVTAKETFDKTKAHAELDIPLEVLATDLNGDGCVDTSDYSILFGAFRVGSYNEKYDLNGDKKLGLEDLKLMTTKYSFPDGASCSVANL